jgi:hypothetical protein
VGSLTWLRATVSRFSAGPDHARRRALVVARLATLDPAELRERARERAPTSGDPGLVPVIVLAEALGARDPIGAAAAVATIAPAYNPPPGPNASSPGGDAAADDAVALLLALLPPGDLEAVAQDIAILVQACVATAALIAGDDPPVALTRRIAPDGTLVEVDLTGLPFGAGPRACPGAEHALALAAGVVEARR